MKIPKAVKRRVRQEKMEMIGTIFSSDQVEDRAWREADRIVRKAAYVALRKWIDGTHQSDKR